MSSAISTKFGQERIVAISMRPSEKTRSGHVMVTISRFSFAYSSLHITPFITTVATASLLSLRVSFNDGLYSCRSPSNGQTAFNWQLIIVAWDIKLIIIFNDMYNYRERSISRCIEYISYKSDSSAFPEACDNECCSCSTNFARANYSA